jgi:hypothetical protein
MRHEIDFSELETKLPPVIARDHVEKLLRGIISSKRFANLDSLGEGPKRMRVGRKVAYLTEDLLEWLAQRTKVLI